MSNNKKWNENKDNYLLKIGKFPTCTSEFYYVPQPTLCNVLRNPALVASQIISVIIYGLFTGSIFNNLETTVDPGVYNRFRALFFIISCQVFGAMNVLEPLTKERALFIHVKIFILNIMKIIYVSLIDIYMYPSLRYKCGP